MGFIGSFNIYSGRFMNDTYFNMPSFGYFQTCPMNTCYSFFGLDSIFTPYIPNNFFNISNYSFNNYFDLGSFSSINYNYFPNYSLGVNNYNSYSNMLGNNYTSNPFAFDLDSFFNLPLMSDQYIPAYTSPPTKPVVSTITEPPKSDKPKREVTAEVKEESVVKPKSAAYPGSEDKRYTTFMEFLFGAEGGYVNDPDDAGGATNMGVTQGTYDDYRRKHGLSTQDVRHITTYEAHDIYYNDYYKESGADRLSDPRMALYVFDTAVNMGVGMAKKLLRESNGDLKTFESLRRSEYQRISKQRNNKKYLRGWLNRVDNVRKFASSLPSGLDVIG